VESLGLGVADHLAGILGEGDLTAEAHRERGEVNDGAAMVGLTHAVTEGTPLADRAMEVVFLALGQRELARLGGEVGRIGAEIRPELAIGPLDEGAGAVTRAELGLKDELSTVAVHQRHRAPGATGKGILMGSLGLGGDGVLAVLPEEVLGGVEEVLTHVAKATLVEVPVAAEGAVGAVRVIRDERRRAAIEIPVEVLGHGLRLEVGPANPEVGLPLDTPAARGDAHGEWTAKDAGGDDTANLTGGTDTVVASGIEAEPGVDAEGHLGLFDHVDQR
jgi:hypothetical protein